MEFFPLSFLETPLDVEDKATQLNPEEFILLNPSYATAVQKLDIEERLDELASTDIDCLADELKNAAIIRVQSFKGDNRQIEKYDVDRIPLFPDLHMRLTMWMALNVRKELKASERQKKTPISILVIFLGSEYAVAYSGLFMLIWKCWQGKGAYGNLPDAQWSSPIRGLQETAIIGKDDFRVFIDITYDTGRVFEEMEARIMERVKNIAGRDVLDLVIASFADKKEVGKMPNSSFLVELNCE